MNFRKKQENKIVSEKYMEREKNPKSVQSWSAQPGFTVSPDADQRETELMIQRRRQT